MRCETRGARWSLALETNQRGALRGNEALLLSTVDHVECYSVLHTVAQAWGKHTFDST